jgi:hypothetical protein
MSGDASRRLSITTFQRRNLLAIRGAVEHHAATCCDRPLGILLNPIDYMALDVDELWGLPVEPDASVTVKRLVLHCVEDHERREASLQQFLDDVLG